MDFLEQLIFLENLFDMAKVLVTGGAGYVGSHCLKLLTEKGHDCVVLDNLERGHAKFVTGCPLIIGDVRNKAVLSEIFANYKFDAIMHFAAFAYVGESVNEPLKYWDNNVLGTKVLLEIALKHNVKKIVFSSSCAVYGEPSSLPIDELAEPNPINPYGYTKLASEMLMDHLDVSDQLKSIRFRYFNAAGSDYLSGIGEWHEPETHLIPLAIENALGFRPQIKVFGNDFSTPDGTAIRDYIHVLDLADAHVAGLEYLLRGGNTQFLNLGTGYGNSVFEIINVIERVTGRKVNYSISDRRPGDPAELVANPAKAKDLLGWVSKRGIDEIVCDAYQWHKIFKELK